MITPGVQTVGNIYNLWLCHAISDLMYGLACKSDTVIRFTVTGVFVFLWVFLCFFVFFCVCFFGGEGLGAKPHL